MSDYTQPICERCWFRLHPNRPPVRVTNGKPEACCYCDEPTRAGIYVRVDPTSVPYPTVR